MSPEREGEGEHRQDAVLDRWSAQLANEGQGLPCLTRGRVDAAAVVHRPRHVPKEPCACLGASHLELMAVLLASQLVSFAEAATVYKRLAATVDAERRIPLGRLGKSAARGIAAVCGIDRFLYTAEAAEAE